MIDRMISRRQLILTLGAVAATLPILQACGASSSAATAQSASTTAQSTTSPAASSSVHATSTSAQASTTAAAKSQAAPQAKISLSIAVWTAPSNGRTWQKLFAQQWAKEHPNVDLHISQVPYGDMAKKQLVLLAAHQLWDVSFSGVKWMYEPIVKGAFRPLDAFVARKDPGMKDFFPATIEDCKYNGKLYAIPFETNSGNTNIIFYNKDLLDAKGLKEPTNDWTVDEFLNTAIKATDLSKQIFGTDLYPGTYYDFDTWVRSWGGELLADHNKKFNLVNNPKAIDAAQWIVNLRTKYQCAPSLAASKGLSFTAGKVALSCQGLWGVVGNAQAVGNRFKMGIVLPPKGPPGLQGDEAWATVWNIATQSKHPDEAYDLVYYESTPKNMLWAFVNQGQPVPRISVWESKEAAKISPIWDAAAKWMTTGKSEPFPEPYNLRFNQLQDTWANVSQQLWYGQVAFQAGIQKVQTDEEAIMAQPIV